MKRFLITLLWGCLGLSAMGQAIVTSPIHTPVYSQLATFSPLSLSPTLWLDASDASTITLVSSAVSQWNDKSGNGRHATQGTVASRPAMGTLNGLPALSLISSNNPSVGSWMVGNIPSGSNTSNLTMFGVAQRINSANTWQMVVYLGNGSTSSAPGTPHLGKRNATTQFGVHNSWRVDQGVFLDQGASWNSPFLSSYRRTGGTNGNGGNLEIGVNGVIATGTQAWVSDASVNYAIGYQGQISNVYTWGGLIGEILIYPTALATTDRQKIEGYLAWKWGTVASLPTNHPYKNAAP